MYVWDNMLGVVGCSFLSFFLSFDSIIVRRSKRFEEGEEEELDEAEKANLGEARRCELVMKKMYCTVQRKDSYLAYRM